MRLGLESADDVVDEVLVGVEGADSAEGSMTMRRRVGWRACRDMLAILCILAKRLSGKSSLGLVETR